MDQPGKVVGPARGQLVQYRGETHRYTVSSRTLPKTASETPSRTRNQRGHPAPEVGMLPKEDGFKLPEHVYSATRGNVASKEGMLKVPETLLSLRAQLLDTHKSSNFIFSFVRICFLLLPT